MVGFVGNFLKFHIVAVKGAGERGQATELSVQVALGAANWRAAQMDLRPQILVS